jgi:hypothetical protein
MFLGLLTLVLIVAVAYAYVGEDLPTAFTMFVNVLLAGLVAFNYFEPLAAGVEAQVDGTPLQGYEDAIFLVGLFCLTLGPLRWAVNNLSPSLIEFPPLLQRGGALLFGALTGYLLAGFLLCVFQTLPLPERFMGFQADAAPSGLRRILPPDRVWLALMHRAGAYAFSNSGGLSEVETFDKDGSFEARYALFRRINAEGNRLKYRGEYEPSPREHEKQGE